jgi:long-chain acyl-CoA synthetase
MPTQEPGWFRHYDKGVPASLQPYPERTLLDCLDDALRERPDNPFLVFKGRRLSYADVDRLSSAFAAALVARGVRKGDRIAIVLPNCPQAIVAQLAAWKAGAIAAPMNPLYTERELEYTLRACGATTAVVLTPFYAALKAVQPRTWLVRIVATGIKEYLPPLLRLLFTLAKERKGGHRITIDPADEWFADLVREHAGAPRPAVEVRTSAPALLLFTGGTTGTPKAAVGTHQGLLISGMQVNAWTRDVLPDWAGSRLMVIPLFHVYGNLALLASAIVGHNPIVLVPNPRDIDDVIATIEKTRPEVLAGVPTLFIAMLNHPKVVARKADLSSLRLCVSGAAPLLTDTKRRFEATTGSKVIEGYSLTEAMLSMVANPVHGVNKPGSVGVPFPDVEVRIVDAEDGKTPMAAGQVGELILRAPQVMKGYWEAPGETAEMLRDGWLYTGDLAYMDEDGYTFVVDRKKDLIKPSGFQVWPREVEEVIAAHPAVNEVAVAGVRDAHQGEAVKAWIVLKTSAHATMEDIRSYCRERLAAYKVPKHVEFRTSLPKTMIGKVLRRALRDEECGEDLTQPSKVG